MAGFVPDNAEYTYQFNGNNFIVFARRKWFKTLIKPGTD